MNIGINGLGRIGKLVFRLLLDYDDIKTIVINDPIQFENIVHLIKYDSIHGRFTKNVIIGNNSITIQDKHIFIYHHTQPQNIPWKKHKIHYVVESSGQFKTADNLKLHLDAGAENVILCQPALGLLDKTVVMGVNEQSIVPSDKLISNASCTTNCIAPLLSVLHKNYNIEKAFFTTVHPFTSNQSLLDGQHADLRRSRSAMCNIIPTSSTAVGAIETIIPELTGKVDGFATRVPIPIGAYVEIVAKLQNSTSTNEINSLIKYHCETTHKNIIAYTEDPLVSSDIVGLPYSAIFDSLSTKCIGGDLVQLLAWYDNETGYSHRVVDLIKHVQQIKLNQ